MTRRFYYPYPSLDQNPMLAETALSPSLTLRAARVDADSAQDAAANARHELTLLVRALRKKGHTWGEIARALNKRGLTDGDARWNVHSLWAFDRRSVNYVGSHGID